MYLFKKRLFSDIFLKSYETKQKYKEAPVKYLASTPANFKALLIALR